MRIAKGARGTGTDVESGAWATGADDGAAVAEAGGVGSVVWGGGVPRLAFLVGGPCDSSLIDNNNDDDDDDDDDEGADDNADADAVVDDKNADAGEAEEVAVGGLDDRAGDGEPEPEAEGAYA